MPKLLKKKEKVHPVKQAILKKHKKETVTERILKDIGKKGAIEVKGREYIKTGIKGLDELFDFGIPKGATVLMAGGAGSGKTILCLQIIANAVKEGKKCIYMSFEESEKRLRQHMEDFKWDANDMEKKGMLLIKRFKLFDIARSIEAMLSKAKGDVEIEIEPMILPKDFKPDIIVVDSLTAIASAFIGMERNYRVYIEQLFLFFEKLNATAFLITETKEVPTVFSPTGVEEFLADGVIVLYNIRKGDIREKGIEVIKMRGAGHKTRIVAMRIVGGVGIEVYSDVEVFGKIKAE